MFFDNFFWLCGIANTAERGNKRLSQESKITAELQIQPNVTSCNTGK
jgi:hypothetical protein